MCIHRDVRVRVVRVGDVRITALLRIGALSTSTTTCGDERDHDERPGHAAHYVRRAASAVWQSSAARLATRGIPASGRATERKLVSGDLAAKGIPDASSTWVNLPSSTTIVARAHRAA
jgi:hypothetical protein